MSFASPYRASAAAEAAVTEPVIVDTMSVDEVIVRAGRHTVKLIGVSETPETDDDNRERRIVSRLSLTRDAALSLWADLAAALRQDAGALDPRPAFTSARPREMVEN